MPGSLRKNWYNGNDSTRNEKDDARNYVRDSKWMWEKEEKKSETRDAKAKNEIGKGERVVKGNFNGLGSQPRPMESTVLEENFYSLKIKKSQGNSARPL